MFKHVEEEPAAIQNSEIDELADRITQALVEAGETLETMLQALREERERYSG